MITCIYAIWYVCSPGWPCKKKKTANRQISFINIEWNEIKKNKNNKIEKKKMDIFVVPAKYGNTLYQ